LTKDELSEEFRPIIMEVLAELKVTLNRREQFALEKVLIDELLGFGPLEELLNDPDVTDIMVNGPEQTYIEKKGKLTIAPIRFRDESHLFQIAQRIVNQVGRRVDQTTPLADARLKDGSRVNVIVPPLSLRGTAISIRKFSEKPITLDMLRDFGSMSDKMCTALKVAGACRMNIVISGGTGSGKTTMLNALSKMIDPGERVLTIEDAAELRLQQPHWLPLETRPPNLEGQGAITIGDLVKNALRMRPDRIILGEIRGAECFDLLAAMNTGHDGSMCTLHANSPRECLGRMENMIMMGDIKIPKEAISRQIAESVDLIVQVKRLRDGSRRTTNVTEVIGMEGDVIVTQELFKFEYLDESEDGKIIGEFRSTGLRLHAGKGAPVRVRPGLPRRLPLTAAACSGGVEPVARGQAERDAADHHRQEIDRRPRHEADGVGVAAAQPPAVGPPRDHRQQNGHTPDRTHRHRIVHAPKMGTKRLIASPVRLWASAWTA
jgi:pilus assembly protein CpaF